MSFVAVQKAYTEATFREAENLTHPHELIQVTLQTLRQSLDLFLRLDKELWTVDPRQHLRMLVHTAHS